MVLMAKIYIETYGCTLNQSDTDIIKALLADRHTLTESEENSDVIIINTCTVKEATFHRSRTSSSTRPLRFHAFFLSHSRPKPRMRPTSISVFAESIAMAAGGKIPIDTAAAAPPFFNSA